jgi:geranylgeranylglycerol-phosphate geranylgeranyltransferase
MIDLLRLCRLYYCVPLSFAYGLTVCYALGDRLASQWPGMLWSSLALMLVVAAAYVLNDVLDADVDRINAPARPIAAGRVSRRVGAIWAAVLAAAGLAVGLLCRWPFLAGLAVLATGLAIYDLLSKRLGPVKQLAVAVLTTAIYPLAVLQAGGATGSRAATLAFFPLWLFLTAFAYEGFKDIRDRAGDYQAAGGANWIAGRPRLAVGLFRMAAVLGGLSLIAPASAGCGRIYAILVAPAIIVAVTAAFLSPRRVLAAIYVECVLVGLAATADLAAAAS